ncbi:MAG: TonB-dependent receptor [Bryobacteraceae bacterium]
MAALPVLTRSTLRKLLLLCVLVKPLSSPAFAQEQPRPAAAQQDESTPLAPPEDVSEAESANSDEGTHGAEVAVEGEEEGPKRSNAVSGAALRNENVFAAKVDNAGAKADGQRLGGTYIIIPHAVVETNFYATEYSQPTTELPVLARPPMANTWHGEIYETLQNSVFNARTFFQVGPVLPSRMNNYGIRFSGKLPGWGYLSGSFGQVKNHGMVNGNVIVPLLSERTPLATDPATRAIVQRFINAYPATAPNRPDFDTRALNTNSPQSTDSTDGSLRLDGRAGAHGIVSISHAINRQRIDAFQLVAGQNPDTSIHTQRFRSTYRWEASEATEFSVSGGFTRMRSSLQAEPNAVGPRVRFFNVIQNLGPDSFYPLDRAENTFHWGALGYHHTAGGKHRITFGGDMNRYQLNGMDQNGSRGDFQFNSNWGFSATENLLRGTPTSYAQSFGNMYRGYRNWISDEFIADQWNVTRRLQLYVGVRHSMNTAPREVNNLDVAPFRTDWNNFSPRFSFAVLGPREWVVRGSYTVSFSQVMPATYSQMRYNPPGSHSVTVNFPDPSTVVGVNQSLTNPLAGVDLTSPNARSTVTLISPDLVAPYSHQYNFTIEKKIGPAVVDIGYLGSRSIKLLNYFSLNRGLPVDGIPLTTATVNQRRQDPRYYEVSYVVNAGIGYLDAAQVSWRVPFHSGLSLSGSFTFGKALDQGVSYLSAAAARDNLVRPQQENNALEDKKGLSDFDSTRALSMAVSYTVPRYHIPGLLAKAAHNWQISGVAMMKTGTPFALYTGSDAPGFGNVDGVPTDRPNLLDPSILGAVVGDPATSTQILSKSKFAFISAGQPSGNLGFNVFRRGPIRNMNAALSREFALGQNRARTLQFRAEVFNLGNHPQFDAPANILTSSSFGKITNTLNNGRVIQFGLRLTL